MKLRYLLALFIPLTALSGCSYSGELKPLQDGEFLIRGDYEVRDDSFDDVEFHMNAGNTFCVYFSQDGCSECESFDPGFRDINKDNKLLTLHLNATTRLQDINHLIETYPSFSRTTPSFYIVQGTDITELKYSQINSKTKFANNLKRTVSLSQHYYFEKTFDYQKALENGHLDQATLIEVDLTNETQKSEYHSILKDTSGPIFIRHRSDISSIQKSVIAK